MKTVLIFALAVASTLSPAAHAGGSDIGNSLLDAKIIELDCRDLTNRWNLAIAHISLDKNRAPNIFMKTTTGAERRYSGVVDSSDIKLIQDGWDVPKISVGSIDSAVLSNSTIGQEYKLDSDLGGFLCRVVDIAK